MRKILLMVAILALAGAVSTQGGEIHQAAAAGDLARVGELLAGSPDLVNAPEDNPTLDLPLHSAAIAGHIEVAGLLLEKGALVDGGDVDRSTPLHVAALRNQPEMVAFLLDTTELKSDLHANLHLVDIAVSHLGHHPCTIGHLSDSQGVG